MALFENLDRLLFIAINSWSGINAFDLVMLFLSNFKLWLAAGLLCLIYIFIRGSKQLKQDALLCLFVVIFTDAICFRALKPSFERLRPCYQIKSVNLVTPSCGSDYGFPSNHAANAFAFAAFTFLLGYRKAAKYYFLIAILVSFTRIYLGVHFPGDVLMGAVVGLCCAFIFYLPVKTYRK